MRHSVTEQGSGLGGVSEAQQMPALFERLFMS